MTIDQQPLYITGTLSNTNLSCPVLPLFARSASFIMIRLWLWVFVPVLLAVCHVLYNLLLHPLRKFPGPVLASATSYWKAWKEVVLQETMAQELFKLHDKCGKMACPARYMVDQSLSDTSRR
jgi:hypothetical protein